MELRGDGDCGGALLGMVRLLKLLAVGMACASVLWGCAISLETVAIPTETTGWKLGHGVNRRAVTMMEFIPEGETPSSWTRMLTIQFLEGNRASPRGLMAGQLANLRAICPDAASTVLAEDATSITYEWKVRSCAGQADQHELVRFLRGNDGAHRIAYVRKARELEPAERAGWLKSFADAQVVKDGKQVVLSAR